MNLLKRIAVLAVAALSLLAVHAQSRDSITTVYVIFKTHLDVGFTDLSSKVEQNYLNEFIPKALDVAERLRADRSGERYVWTTGAWLVWEYLHQAPPADVKRLERAIRRGDIVWNGVPYTVESEAMNRALFEGGLALSARLDKRYHRHTVATKMTDVPDPVFGAVYKIAAIEKDGVVRPTIKVSESVEKITNPGRKKVYRIYDGTGHAVCDLIALEDETVDLSEPFRVVDPVKPWKDTVLRDCTARELLHPVIRDGRRVLPPRSLSEIRDYVDRQLRDEIWEGEQRFENPHVHNMDMTPAYYDFKMDLLRKTDDFSD